ncbi:lymphatic vessel endothelial hyaluronic receptor 1b [Brachyistius frenatus]|uniref:lymphatic vessel endothelial hyaluronic receptor 1b n=1 Tax=Brachyistius frenatus TaxID=100188 RepID=UPI0037E6F8A9
MSAVPQNHRAAGVFMLPEGGDYTLNFRAARAACLFLNVTMATREQMERAVQHGLETCKFGWTAEMIVAIPRLSSDIKCGKGKTGVVTWFAPTDRKFGVFCFNASGTDYLLSDSKETLTTWTASHRSSTSSSSLTAATRSSAAASPSVTSTTESPPTTRTPEKTALTSASALPVQTSRSSRVSSSTSSSLPVSTHPTAAPSQRVTLTVVSLPFSTSVHTSSVSVSTVSSAEVALGAALTALVTLGVAVLLLAAAGVMWYHKLTVRRCWSERQQRDDVETEMWKHTDSETDLHSQHGAEGDDDHDQADRKYSSDITLCVNPDIKAHSLE